MDLRLRDEGADMLEAAGQLEPLVRSARAGFDKERQLPRDLVDAIGRAGLFAMWLPRALGGPELPPLSFLEVIEELSRQDGSVGWCTVIPAGYARLAGGMAPQAAREIFSSGRSVLVGTLNPAGKAVAVPGGYRVTGRWSYGSFIAHSQWVLGGCGVQDDPGAALRLCIFPRADVEVIDVWNVGGLRGTGSNDYRVTDVFVPEERAVPIPGFSPVPVQPGALYAVPMLATFVSCIAIPVFAVHGQTR
jgi:alkylation response protein AidB-like acyl-CoA dehydrogenase